MQDDMLFCQKCGTKSVIIEESINSDDSNMFSDDPSIRYANNYNSISPFSKQKNAEEFPVGMRKGMKVGMIVCLVLAFIYAILAIPMGLMLTYFGMAGFFVILALMFLILAKSPKESPFLLGKSKGLKKSIFVLICVILAFSLVGILAPLQSDLNESTVPSTIDNQETIEIEADTESGEATTLSDVQAWYEKQMPAVGQKLSEYAQSVEGLSDLNVDSSRFLFGGDYNDCYYKFSFHCKVNGVNHIGEARAFLKYQDSLVNWFSFEIFGNDSLQSVVELYDDSYDQIIEDYYKELEANYS